MMYSIYFFKRKDMQKGKLKQQHLIQLEEDNLQLGEVPPRQPNVDERHLKVEL